MISHTDIDKKDKKESIQDAIKAARMQLDLFIRYAEKQGTNGDLIQYAGSVKAMLPVLM